jgi:hypothetical protein
MLAPFLCFFAFVICFVCGRRALCFGLMATIIVGYFYGIIRANLESHFSHFIFDAGALGFYLALAMRRESPIQRFKLRPIVPWVLVLGGWPVLIMLLPLQSPLIQLVGLRAQIFFLPFILVGAMLDSREMKRVASLLAILSLIELGFALAEIELGLTAFYPLNAVDQLIYNSVDVAIGATTAFRIPATFVQSAAYGGNMALSLPLLLGAVVQTRTGSSRRNLFLVAIAAAALGVFLSASRSWATMLFVVGLTATFSGRIKNFPWFGWIGLIAIVGVLVAVSPRMQRFVTLQDTSYVKKRFSNSINSSFLDLAIKYPLGNGLGGGGTSLPYFLESQLRNPVQIENEYGRILLEEGLFGLALWLSFILWALTRPLPNEADPWYLGKWLARVTLFYCFLTGMTGTGLLTSVPATLLVLVFIGWTASPTVTADHARATIRGAPGFGNPRRLTAKL